MKLAKFLVLVGLVLMLPTTSNTVHADDWEKTTTCATTTSFENFQRIGPSCWAKTKLGSASYYAEDHMFQTEEYLVLTHLALAGPHTVWTKSDPKSVLNGVKWWFDEQDAKITKAPERTVLFNMWTNRARSWDIETRDYEKGCFAFSSSGGSKGGSGLESYHFVGVVCNRNGNPIPVEGRNSMSQSFAIEHRFYRGQF